MDAYDGNARMKGVERLWTGCSYFFLLMADREEDARAGVEEDRRASLNEEREREMRKGKRNEENGWIVRLASFNDTGQEFDGR